MRVGPLDDRRSSPGRRLLKETTRSRSQLGSCLRELERASAFTAKNEEDAGRKKTPKKIKAMKCVVSHLSAAWHVQQINDAFSVVALIVTHIIL